MSLTQLSDTMQIASALDQILSLIDHATQLNHQKSEDMSILIEAVNDSMQREHVLMRKIDDNLHKHSLSEQETMQIARQIGEAHHRIVKQLNEHHADELELLLKKHHSEVQKLKNKYSKLKNHHDESDDYYQLIIDENKMLKTKIAEVEKENDCVRNDLSKCKKDYENITKEYEDRQQKHLNELQLKNEDIKNWIQKYNDLKEENNKHMETVSLAISELTSSSDSFIEDVEDDCHDSKVKPKNHKNELKRQIHAKDTVMQVLHSNIRNLEDKIKEYQASLYKEKQSKEECLRQMESLSSEIEQLKSNIQTPRNDCVDDQEQKLKSKIEKLEQKLEVLLTDIEEVKRKNASLIIIDERRLNKMKILEEENISLKKNVDALKYVVAKVDKESEAFCDTITNYAYVEKDFSKERSQLYLELEESRRNLHDAMDDIERLNAERSELVSELESVKEAFEKENQQNKVEINFLQKRLKDEISKNAKVSDRLKEFEEYDLNTQYLRKRLNDLKEETSLHLTKISRLERLNNQYSKTERKHLKEINELKDFVGELNKKIFVLEQTEEQQRKLLLYLGEYDDKTPNSKSKKKLKNDLVKCKPGSDFDRLNNDFLLAKKEVQELRSRLSQIHGCEHCTSLFDDTVTETSSLSANSGNALDIESDSFTYLVSQNDDNSEHNSVDGDAFSLNDSILNGILN